MYVRGRAITATAAHSVTRGSQMYPYVRVIDTVINYNRLLRIDRVITPLSLCAVIVHLRVNPRNWCCMTGQPPTNIAVCDKRYYPGVDRRSGKGRLSGGQVDRRVLPWGSSHKLVNRIELLR